MVMTSANAHRVIRRRSATGRLARLASTIVVLLVLVNTAGFALYTWHVVSTVQPSSIGPADAIIVLTGGQDRLEPAFALLAKGSAKRLLVSGVNPATRKADIGTALKVDPALISCCVDLDHKALDTIGNADQSARWLRANGFSSAILVTSNYHMPRAKRELERLAGSARIIAYPLVASDLSGFKWLTRPDALRVLVTEYLKLCLSLVRNAVSPAPNTMQLARI
jgi:uncharacterized SAM-binding protein YcdF (DUF218 family)